MLNPEFRPPDVIVHPQGNNVMGEASQERIEPLKSEFAADPDMAELVQEFIAELPARVDSVVSAYKEYRAADLQRISHQLKGAGGGYGFPTITDAAAKVEHLLKAAADRDEVFVKSIEADVRALVDLCVRAAASGRHVKISRPNF